MHRSTLFAVAVLGALTQPRSPAFADEFQPLFNGKDLTGWEGDPNLWSVKDGAIFGQTDGRSHTFLIWKGTAGDFELHAKFKMKGGNSGIQYRSKQVKDAGDFVVSGYQADMDAENKYTGILYEERGRGILAMRGEKVIIAANGDRYVVGSTGDPKKLTAAIKPDDWNDYVIRCEGPHIQLWINGLKTVDYTETEPDIAQTGVIGVQIHGGAKAEASYKDIVIEEMRAK